MKTDNIEQIYDSLFASKVLPFIKRNLKKDFYSLPSYYLLEKLKTNRFRGSLPLIIAQEYKTDVKKLLPLSMACELTFATACAQDDFYDNDLHRENLVATHKKFGLKQTLLSADYSNHQVISLLIKSLRMYGFSNIKINRVMEIMNDAMKSWYLSVLMEMNSKQNLLNIDEEYIKTIYKSKTVHGQASLLCTFVLLQDNEEVVQAVKKYGEYLGLAGQLKNDLYDFTKYKKYRGLSDVKSGHITWLLYLLFKTLTKKEKKLFLKDLHNKKGSKIMKTFKDKKITEKALRLINFYTLMAKRSIESIEGKIPNTVERILLDRAENNRQFSARFDIHG